MIPAMNLFPFRRRDCDPGSRCEPKGSLDISWFRECHVRGANVSSRNLDSYPPSVMLFGRALGGRRRSEPSAVMLLYDTRRQTDLELRDGLVVLGPPAAERHAPAPSI